VGESAAGKTVTALSIMGLVESSGRITGGRIVFQGRDLLQLQPDEMREVRGSQVPWSSRSP